MTKLVKWNLVTVNRMRCEPIALLFTLYTFCVNSEQNIKLSHDFSLLSRFFLAETVITVLKMKFSAFGRISVLHNVVTGMRWD
jgi:hypothetical protein